MTSDKGFADGQQLPSVNEDGSARMHEETKDELQSQAIYQPTPLQGKSGRTGSFEIPRMVTGMRDDNRQRRSSSGNLFICNGLEAQYGTSAADMKHLTALEAKDCVPRENRAHTGDAFLDKQQLLSNVPYPDSLNMQNTSAMSASAGNNNRLSTPAQPHTTGDAGVPFSGYGSDGGKVEQYSRTHKNVTASVSSSSDGQHPATSAPRRRSSLQYVSSGMMLGSSAPGLGQKAGGDVALLDDDAFIRHGESGHNNNTPISTGTSTIRASGSKQASRAFGHRHTESTASGARSDITQYASALEVGTAADTSSSPAVTGVGSSKTPPSAVKVYRTASHSHIGTKNYPTSGGDVAYSHIDKSFAGGYAPSASGSHSGYVGKKKRGSTWLQALNPNYKYRAEEFKRYFVTPSSRQQYADERLVIDYSCALHREILCQGRMYCSQHRLCFRFNIFGVERSYAWPWTDITSIYKDKTALIIPNAISVRLAGKHGEHLFFTTFNARDKAFAMLLRLWQSANAAAAATTPQNHEKAAFSPVSVSGVPSVSSVSAETSSAREHATVAQHAASDAAPLTTDEIWGLVHFSYGDDLGLTTDDEGDYIPPAYLKYSYDSIHDNAAMLASGSSGGSGSSKTKAAFLDSNRRPNHGKLFSSGHSYNNTTTTSKEHVTPKKRHATSDTKAMAVVGDAVASTTKPSSSAANVPRSVSNSSIEATEAHGGSPRTKFNKQDRLPAALHDACNDKYAVRHAEAGDRATRTYAVGNDSPAPTTDTDMSADNNNDDVIDLSMILPDNLPEPAGVVVLDEHFDLSVDQVFVMLFSDTKFSRDFFARRGFTDCQPTGWGDVSPAAAEFAGSNHPANDSTATAAVHERTITYRVKVMPGQYSTSVERQRLLPESINGYLYLVETEVRSSGVMYSDSFAIHCHYALTRTGDNNCRLCVHGETVFLKRVLLAKSMIETRVASTFREHFGTLRAALQEATRDELPKLMGTSHAGGTSTAAESGDDVGLKQKMPELHKLADPPPSSRRTSTATTASKQRQHADYSLSSNSSFASTHNKQRRQHAQQPKFKEEEADTSDDDDDEKRSTLRANVAPPTSSHKSSNLSALGDSYGNGHRRRKTSAKPRHQSQSPVADAPPHQQRMNEAAVATTNAHSPSHGVESSHRCSACGHTDTVAASVVDGISYWTRMRSLASPHSAAVTMLLCTLIGIHLLLLWRLGHPHHTAVPLHAMPSSIRDNGVDADVSASLASLNVTINAVRNQLGVLLVKLAVDDVDTAEA